VTGSVEVMKSQAFRSQPEVTAKGDLTMFATIARFCVARRRWVLAAWVLLLVIGLAAGAMTFMRLKDSNSSGSSESARGAAIVAQATRMGPSVVVLVQGPPVNAASTRAAVQALTAKLDRVPGVTGAVNTYTSPNPQLRSRDGHASLIVVSLRKGIGMTPESTAVTAMRADAVGAVPGAQVKIGGDAAVMADNMNASTSDLIRANLIAFPVLLVALFFIFGGLRAALLPLFAALAASAGTFIPLLGVTYLTGLASYALDVVMLLGLGLAVDYSLLMVNRFREARATGADVPAAVEHTMATAGRTVTFSALTVATALSGLFAFGDPSFTSVAVAGIATVLVALAAALTLVPALLACWGPKLGAARRQNAEDGLFGRLARKVQARPWLAAVGVAGLLAAAALPFLHAHYGNGDPRALPASAQSRQVAQTLAARFPGMGADPIQVVTRIPATDPRIGAYAASLAHQPGVAAVSVEHELRGNVSVIDVIPSGSTQGAAAHLVDVLRGHRPAFRTWVTGSAASLADFKAEIASRAPYAAAWIALATFALLFLMTGSVLIPLKALVMNTLSLGATFGALVWVFQDGHLASVLGFTAFGAIEAWAPVIIFTFAFGLSMDYEVFLLSRIKEAYDETGNTNDAVAHGLQRSGRIITSAAFAILIVFAGFAAGQTLGIKEMGLALAIAVAVDATLVRCVLVPATMTLLGKANWWAPGPLRRLHHRIGLHEAPALPASPATALPPAALPAAPAVHGRELADAEARREEDLLPIA
jgi:RND superfamily putative drug exporter